MASEQDAARDRVLAARADLEAQVETLQASGRAAVDIPARIRQSPAKAAAIGAAVGFLSLKGPQRLYGAVRKAIFGTPAPLPKRMLPKDIEKTLRSMGDDGDKVRGTLERDFAAYVKKAEKDRRGLAVRGVIATGSTDGRAGPKAGRGVPRSHPVPRATRRGSMRCGEGRCEARGGARLPTERAAEAAKERVDQVRPSGPRSSRGQLADRHLIACSATGTSRCSMRRKERLRIDALSRRLGTSPRSK